MRLTDLTIRNLKHPETGVKIVYDDTLKGFGVRLTAKSKTFILATGKNRDRSTIGKYGQISLQDARRRAQELIGERAAGKLRLPRKTFEDALVQFIETRQQRNRAFTVYETERLLRVYFKPLHRMQLADIRAHHIADVTDALSKSGRQSTASHAHTAVKTFLKFCAQRHYLIASPIADMEKPVLPKSRERVLDVRELQALWSALDETPKPFSDIVKLLILTGQRRSEIGSLQTSWISLGSSSETSLQSSFSAPVFGSGGHTSNTASICIPRTHTKNKRSHTFPIGALAASILSSQTIPTAGLCFAARGKPTTAFNGWSKSKAALDKKVADHLRGVMEMVPWTLHDLRRTYATNLQRLGIKLEVIEALLNHVSGTRAGIVGVYQRHQYEAEMREAVHVFENWFTNTIIQP